MRSAPKLLSLLVLVCLMGLASADERLENWGIPSPSVIPTGANSRTLETSDLKAFDGKIYVGHGDCGLNSGPTDLWYYDLHKNEFVKQGQIEDEAADHFRVINGRLYLPGTDPREDWSLGNFYRLPGFGRSRGP